ncbi:MAG: PrsW family glutamic-type intramembrane protease [Planctomycetota bacterium]|jgi:RsiW-degrading membrane proteinase PrsW (M82 family)
MTTPEDYFDVRSEPVNTNGPMKPDPCEQKVPAIDGREDEISTVRDSVLNEPAFTGELKQAHLGQWLTEKRKACSPAGNWVATLLAGLIGGSFAVIGAFVAGRQTWVTLLYMILFAPIIEELLKQSGMIYLLEKKPFRLSSSAQFIVAAVLSALVFSAIENVLYIHLCSGNPDIKDFQAFTCFRWTWCTLLHVSCSVIASFGLIRVWKRQVAEGRAADLGCAFPAFAVAMGIHGAYNLTMALLNLQF